MKNKQSPKLDFDDLISQVETKSKKKKFCPQADYLLTFSSQYDISYIDIKFSDTKKNKSFVQKIKDVYISLKKKFSGVCSFILSKVFSEAFIYILPVLIFGGYALYKIVYLVNKYGWT